MMSACCSWSFLPKEHYTYCPKFQSMGMSHSTVIHSWPTPLRKAWKEAAEMSTVFGECSVYFWGADRLQSENCVRGTGGVHTTIRIQQQIISPHYVWMLLARLKSLGDQQKPKAAAQAVEAVGSIHNEGLLWLWVWQPRQQRSSHSVGRRCFTHTNRVFGLQLSYSWGQKRTTPEQHREHSPPGKAKGSSEVRSPRSAVARQRLLCCSSNAALPSGLLYFDRPALPSSRWLASRRNLLLAHWLLSSTGSASYFAPLSPRCSGRPFLISPLTATVAQGRTWQWNRAGLWAAAPCPGRGVARAGSPPPLFLLPAARCPWAPPCRRCGRCWRCWPHWRPRPPPTLSASMRTRRSASWSGCRPARRWGSSSRWLRGASWTST